VFWVEIRSYKGEISLHGFYGHLAQLWTEKKTRMCLESLFRSMKSSMDFTKKITGLVSLIVFIVFDDLFGVGTFIYWTLVTYEKWGEY